IVRLEAGLTLDGTEQTQVEWPKPLPVENSLRAGEDLDLTTVLLDRRGGLILYCAGDIRRLQT
ncbi:MAG: hypothetical protein U0223_16720, partial [Nitrospira sp.]